MLTENVRWSKLRQKLEWIGMFLNTFFFYWKIASCQKLLIDGTFLFYSLLFSCFFSSSEIMQNNPDITISAPIHHIKFVVSLRIKHPRIPEMMKFEAVETTVGTNVLESLEWRPLTKYLHTIALETNIRLKKTPFWSIDVSSTSFLL